MPVFRFHSRMIEMRHLNDESIVAVRFRGRLSVCDLNAFCAALVDWDPGFESVRALFDWTVIEGWEPGTNDSALWPNWLDLALPIDRAVILHEHRWNKQAALLAATLRISKTQVRSWLPRDLAVALVWLRGK